MHENIEQMLTEQLHNYRVLRLLNQSHAADIFLGEHLYLNTRVALKVFRQPLSLAESQTFEERIQQIAQLDHPHIVRLLEYVLLEGHPCLVTDFAPHGTLRDHHSQGERLSLTNVVSYLEQITSALQYIHERDLVHGDLKPENVLLNAQDELLLHDFGFTLETQPQQAFGTIFYMAPEQLNGHPSPASDQYALAIMVWEWLTGHYPFRGTYAEVAAQHFQTKPPSLRPYRPDITAELDDVLGIALQKAPEQRFHTIQAFMYAFQQACLPNTPSFQKISTPPTNTQADPIPAQQSAIEIPQTQPASLVKPVTPLPSTTSETSRRIKRRTALYGIAGGTTALIGGGGLLWWLQSQKSQHHHTPTTTTVAPGTLLYAYKGHTTPVSNLVWSPTSSRIASMDDNATHLWAANGIGQIVQLAQANVSTLEDVPRWSPDEKLLIASSLPAQGITPSITIWDAHTGQTVKHILMPQANSVTFANWSSDSRSFRVFTVNASDTPTSLQEREVSSGALMQDMLLTQLPSTTIIDTPSSYYFSISPDGKYILESSTVAVSNDTPIYLVEIQTRAIHSTIVIPSPGNEQSICWSQNGERIGILVIHMYIFDTKTGKLLSTSEEQDTILPGLSALSPDGKYGAFTSNRIIYICEAATGKTLLSYHGHTATISSLAWSPDGTRLASSSRNLGQGLTADTSVHVWQAVV